MQHAEQTGLFACPVATVRTSLGWSFGLENPGDQASGERYLVSGSCLKPYDPKPYSRPTVCDFPRNAEEHSAFKPYHIPKY